MIYIIVLSLLSMLIRPNAVLADTYGGQEEKNNITVDKKIYSTVKMSFVDNIDKSEKVFINGNVVEFSVTVENTGSQELSNIKVIDYLPDYLGLYFYPGTLDKGKKQISWTIDKLAPGEKKSYSIRAKLQNIPTNFESKQTNTAEASANNVSDRDSSVYYIGAATVPVTGPETIILQTMIAFSVAGVGFGIRKLSRGY